VSGSISHPLGILSALPSAQATPAGAGAIANPMRLDAPVKVTICFTESCNLDCTYCYADCRPQRKARELTAPQWLEFIDRALADGVVCVYFEGGEPFHRPDFPQVLEACTRRAFTMVRSNATLIDRERADWLASIGLGTLYVDLLGARAETHDALTGTAGSHARSLDGIRAAVEAGLDTQLLFILNRRNAAELPEYLTLAASLGVSAVGILRLYPLGRAKRRWGELALSLDEMMAAIEAIEAPEGLRIMQSWHPNDANCCWQMAAVNAFGDSIGCAYLREYVNYGNILDTSLAETWRHPLCRELRSGRVEASCGECSDSQGSHGGCRSTAFAFHRRFDAPDPFDRTINRGVDLRVLPDWLL